MTFGILIYIYIYICHDLIKEKEERTKKNTNSPGGEDRNGVVRQSDIQDAVQHVPILAAPPNILVEEKNSPGGKDRNGVVRQSDIQDADQLVHILAAPPNTLEVEKTSGAASGRAAGIKNEKEEEEHGELGGGGAVEGPQVSCGPKLLPRPPQRSMTFSNRKHGR